MSAPEGMSTPSDLDLLSDFVRVVGQPAADYTLMLESFG
jgi:hypothetical protein